MRYTPEHKEQTRQKIVDAASKVFREDGVQKARVEDIMDAVGLTVGGFYKHYDSKEDLLCEALSRALSDSRAMLSSRDSGVTGDAWLKMVSEIYLTEQHRDGVASGCALPALSADVSRATERVRAHFGRELRTVIDEIKNHLEGSEDERERKAWQVTALNLGAIMLARAVNDTSQSAAILEHVRDAFESEPGA